MQKTEEEIAKNKIEEEYKRLVNDKYYKGNAEWDAVSGFLSDAQTRANNVAEDIKDTGLPPILICRIGNPKHDFSAIKKEMERTERRDRNHDDDYDRRRGLYTMGRSGYRPFCAYARVKAFPANPVAAESYPQP